MTEREKMLAGLPYRPDDPELTAQRAEARRWLAACNAAGEAALPALLTQRLAGLGPGAVIRTPFFCDYGFNIAIGAGAFLNFNCVILDVARVEIGAGAQIGPSVQIYAADHPRDAAARRAGLESGRAVSIGRDVWIGGGAIILPGITIGDGAIVGAGAVVTRDVAPGTTVAGNPARALPARQSPGAAP